jgi:hypothetical protein
MCSEEVVRRWLIAQPPDIQDLINVFGQVGLSGFNLRVKFNHSDFAQALKFQAARLVSLTDLALNIHITAPGYVTALVPDRHPRSPGYQR